MFGLSIVKTDELAGMKRELKGFYEGSTDNSQNEYFRALAKQAAGLNLPPMEAMSRDSIKKVYEQSAPVMGVVNYIAENVGEVMRYLELRDIKSGEYLDNHWVLDLLRQPNDRFSLKRFGTAWAINRLLFDDAWVYAPKAMGKDFGKVKEMYVIPSQYVGVKRGETIPMEAVQLIGLGSLKDIKVKGNIFESFGYSLDGSSYFGTSKIVAAATYLSVMEKGMQRQDTALKNGGVANIITPKPSEYGITPSEQEDFEQIMNNRGNVNKSKVIKTPVEVHQLGNAPVDLSILESHKEAVTALCFVFKLPVDLYYGQAKYENAKEAKKTIYEQNAIPMANEFAADLIAHLGLEDQYELIVNTDMIDVLKDKPTDVLDMLEKAHASLNERREAIGYERIDADYADEPMIPMGVMFGNEGGSYDINEME